MTGREFDAVHNAPARRQRRTPTVVSSKYRCRIHTEERVTVKGTGCRVCTPPPTPRRRSEDDGSLP